jgi:hypothetical protein
LPPRTRNRKATHFCFEFMKSDGGCTFPFVSDVKPTPARTGTNQYCAKGSATGGFQGMRKELS